MKDRKLVLVAKYSSCSNLRMRRGSYQHCRGVWWQNGQVLLQGALKLKLPQP